MKLALLLTIATGLFAGDFNKISTVNQYKREGENAYKASDYPKAISAFRLLVDSLGVDDESVTLNLANAYFQTSDTTNAAYYYTRVAESTVPGVKSSALNQLGIIDQQKNNLDGALGYFKSALKADPINENARYNYELVKKLLEQQQEQQQDQDQNQDQNQDQENKDQQKDQKQQQQNEQEKQKEEQQQQEQQEQEKKEQEKKEQEEQQQNKDSEKKDEGNPQQEQETKEEGEEMDKQPPKSRQEKLEELNLTEEKARMILEAMKNNEMQYLQQMQRKPTKKQDSDKPDW